MQNVIAGRLHHLDFLRALMMFMGVLVHASHADFDRGDYEFIRFFSGSFRMPCFFIIAGFFSLLVLDKTTFPNFLKKRLLLLGIPALTCVIFLVPATVEWMTEYFQEGGSSNEPHAGWMGHAWFLFVLAFYSLILGALQCAVNKIVIWISRAVGLFAAQALFVFLLVLLAILVSKLIKKFGPGLLFYDDWGFIVSSIVENLPHFVLGMMMYRWSNVYLFLHRYPFLWISAAAILVAIKFHLKQAEVVSTVQHLVLMFIAYAAAIAVSASLFSTALRLMQKHNGAIRAFSESAYTVYIFHYIIIAAVLVELRRMDVVMLARMLVACLIATVLGIVIHIFIVKKSPLAAFLFNGKVGLRDGA